MLLFNEWEEKMSNLRNILCLQILNIHAIIDGDYKVSKLLDKFCKMTTTWFTYWRKYFLSMC